MWKATHVPVCQRKEWLKVLFSWLPTTQESMDQSSNSVTLCPLSIRHFFALPFYMKVYSSKISLRSIMNKRKYLFYICEIFLGIEKKNTRSLFSYVIDRDIMEALYFCLVMIAN